jgi:hypothetical protein
MEFGVELSPSEGRSCDNCEPFQTYSRLGIPFFGDVCPPTTNPLNGKIVGPNLNRLKGRVRVVKWGKPYTVVRTALELEPINEGDIVTNISSEQWSQLGNWPWQFGNLWRELKSVRGVESALDSPGEDKTAAVNVATSTSSTQVPSTDGPSTSTPQPKQSAKQSWTGAKDISHQLTTGVRKYTLLLTGDTFSFTIDDNHGIRPGKNVRGAPSGVRTFRFTVVCTGPVVLQDDNSIVIRIANAHLTRRLPRWATNQEQDAHVATWVGQDWTYRRSGNDLLIEIDGSTAQLKPAGSD